MTASSVRFWFHDGAVPLAAALAPPASAVIERARSENAPGPVSNGDANSLLLRVLSQTASREPVAHLFTSALGQRVTVNEILNERLGIALQEALANALIHGNLELAMRAGDGSCDLDAYYRAVEERLGASPWCTRSISLRATWNTEWLVIDVEDEGTVWEVRESDANADEQPHGRGFLMMRAMTDLLSISPRAHRVTLGFKWT